MSFTNNQGGDRWELGDAIEISLDPEDDPEEPDNVSEDEDADADADEADAD